MRTAKQDTTTKTKSCLIDKKITIVPINKVKTNVYKDKVGGSEAVMLTGASITITCPPDLNARGGKLVRVLTLEEQEYLESILDIDLNPWLPAKDNFFCNNVDSTLKFIKTDPNLDSASLILDLSNPYDFIKYKIALASPRIANSWGVRLDSAYYQFVIKDEDADFSEELTYNNLFATVMGFIANNKGTKELNDLLRLFNLDLPYDKKATRLGNDYIFNELVKLTQDKKSVAILYKLIELPKPQQLQQLFISDAMYADAIKKHGREYRLYTGESLGFSIEEAYTYLSKPENNDIKIHILSKIDEYKKTK